MGNALEFILKLQDMLTPGMKTAAGVSQNASSHIAEDMNKVVSASGKAATNINKVTAETKHLHKELESGGHGGGGAGILGMLGFAGLAFGISEMVHVGMEKAHELHEAEAALKNTMMNMGTYSDGAFEHVIKSSGAMASGILFSRSQVIDLQSQLRLVGNIGEEEMDRLVKASADMATKFHQGLGESGNAIAKAINNPELLRRLAMQLKIDPAMVKHLQNLAKNGHEAQARLELLAVVEQKVGGAAAAAFDADPAARYNKILGAMKLHLGEVAIKVQAGLAPALVWLANVISKTVDWVISIVHWFQEHKVITEVLGLAVGLFTAAVLIYNTVVTLAGWATKAWTVVTTILNATLWANPVTWIVLAIIALIAAIAYVIYTTDGWGKQWDNLVNFFKFSWSAFKDYFILLWEEVQGNFMAGLAVIEKGWYHIKSLWDDKGAQEGEARLAKQANDQAIKIANAKGVLEKDLQSAQAAMKFEIKGNGKGFKDMTGDLKKMLGIKDGVNPASAAGMHGKAGLGLMGKPGADGDLGDDAKSKAAGVNSGGQRSIVINIGKQIEKIEQHIIGGGREAADEIETAVREAMRRVMYSLNGATTS
jgi:hypothetical protein